MFVVFPEYFIFVRHSLQIICVIFMSSFPALFREKTNKNKDRCLRDLHEDGVFLIFFFVCFPSGDSIFLLTNFLPIPLTTLET